jgi:enediyne biosynthesis thioesterase
MNVNVAPILADLPARPRPSFSYHHTVSFEETNVVGNVYFTRHISWQGRCREMFLKQNAPDILGEIARDLRLVTLRVSCEYFEELNAFDEIDVQMSLAHIRQNKLGLNFDYLKVRSAAVAMAARGFQEIGCMRLTERGLVPINVPPSLAQALKPFQAKP